MLKNYIITLSRQIMKYKSNYVLNIFGLAFGIACCLLCFVHVRYEYSFDKFHNDSDRTFRLVTGDPAITDSWVKIAPPISPALKDNIPEVEEYLRFNSVSYNEKVMIAYNDQLSLEPYFMMADPNFFSFFDYPLIQGNPATVLSRPDGIVISQSIAKRLFHDENPLGKIITLQDNKLDFVVTGVMKDLPHHTHLRCDYLISFLNLDQIFGKGSSDSWGQYNYYAYLKLQPGASAKTAQEKINSFTVELPNNQITFSELRLQPISAIHFEHHRGNLIPSYDVRYTYIFSTLALSVLIICFMNYFNVETILSIKRIKEIGIRKSIGATTRQLNAQFISEGVTITFLSLCIGLLIVELLRPLVSSLLGSPIEFSYTDPSLIFMLVGFTLALGILSGAYLSLNVNRVQPASILKGKVNRGSDNKSIQHSLIFIQFSISIILLISSVVIVRQMRFLHNKNLGFDREQVLNVSLPRGLTNATLTSLQTELARSANVQDVALSDFVPGKANWNQTTWWEGQSVPEHMFVIAAGKEFIPALKMKLLEGTTEELLSATEIQFLINESARNQIGWETAKGKFLSPFGEANKRAVVGVVEDFNFQSLHSAVAPLVLVIYPEKNFSQLSVRLEKGQLAAGVKEVEKVFKQVTGSPFEFTFMDDQINKLYQGEIRMENTILILTIVAICFALLGIYALISLTIENRTKEIAIRKVLGISTENLITLFTKAYLKIVLLASVVAVPICWKIWSQWLLSFENRIELNLFGFIVVVIGMIVLVGIVGVPKYLSLSKINPANSLKVD